MPRHPPFQGLAGIGALVLVLAGASSPVRGSSWTPIGPYGGSIATLAVSPVQPSLVYGGSPGGGFYRSEDGGATWVRASRGIDPQVLAVVADPQNALTVYEISETSTMKSVDGGTTWSPVSEPNGPNPILSLAIDPRSPTTLYGGATTGIWKSTDGGLSWTPLNGEVGLVNSLVVDWSLPSTALYAFASDPGILVRSIDSGNTWSEADNGLPSFTESLPNAQQLVVDPSTRPATVYFSFLDSSNVGFFQRSTDMAASWTSPTGLCPCSYPVAVGAGVVYAGPAVSKDHGATWAAAAAPPGSLWYALAAAPGAAATVYAGTSLGTWKSVDASATWLAASHGLAATETVALAVDPVHPRILYAAVGADPTLLLRSGNGGQSWRPIGPPSLSNNLQSLVIDPVTPTTLYAASSSGLVKSIDSGSTWEPLDTPCNGLTQLAIDPQHPETLYAAGPLGPLTSCQSLKSTDGGHNWRPLPLPGGGIKQIAVAPSTPSTLYALAPFLGIFKSADAGVTWRRLGIPSVAPVLLAIDPTNAERVFMATISGIFGTTDGGRTWNEFNHTLPIDPSSFFIPTALAIDPHYPNLIYTGGSFGIYRTTNGGKTWYPIVGDLPDFANTPPPGFAAGGLLVLDPRQPGKLYAGTVSNGVYTYTGH